MRTVVTLLNGGFPESVALTDSWIRFLSGLARRLVLTYRMPVFSPTVKPDTRDTRLYRINELASLSASVAFTVRISTSSLSILSIYHNIHK